MKSDLYKEEVADIIVRLVLQLEEMNKSLTELGNIVAELQVRFLNE